MDRDTYPIITNFNFDTVSDYSGPAPSECPNRFYGFFRQSPGIIKFSANFAACPCIYYVKEGPLFCYSFDVDSVVDFAKKNGIKLTDTFDNLNSVNSNIREHIKRSVLLRYKYNVNYIEGWESVILRADGVTYITKNTFKPFIWDVRNHPKELLAFLDKYRKYVGKLIDRGEFIPSLTGGLDTRYLLGLCREKKDLLPGYYLKSIKPDGKGNKAKGLLEVKLASETARAFGMSQKRFESLTVEGKDYYTMTGMFNENANTYRNPNDPEYITKILQHGWANKVIFNYGNAVMPFIDDDYLKFRQEGEFMRVLLTLLLIPDLCLIPLISGTSIFNEYPEGYSFTQLEPIGRACQLIKEWKKYGAI